MEKRMLGNTGMQVSIITFGGIVVDQMAQTDANQIVAEAVDRGVNYFDVAPSYGNAQYVLGPALKPYRNRVYLACKTGKRTAIEARAEIEESLKALQTDYFDNYQLHGLDDPQEIETVFAPGGAMETLHWALDKGYTKHIGFTCHQDTSALSILRHADFHTMLFPVNYAYRLVKSGSCDAIAACREKGMGIIAIKAMAHRKWMEDEVKDYPKCWYKPITDTGMARSALNYTLSQDIDTAVPPGDSRLFRLALDIIESQNGKPAPVSQEDGIKLKEFTDASQIIF